MSYLLRSRNNLIINSSNVFENKPLRIEISNFYKIKNYNIEFPPNESNSEEENLSDNEYLKIKKQIRKRHNDMHGDQSVSYCDSGFSKEKSFFGNTSKLKRNLEIDRSVIASDYQINKKSFAELQDKIEEDKEEEYENSTDIFNDNPSSDELSEDVLNMIRKKYDEKKSKNLKIKKNQYLLEDSDVSSEVSKQRYKKDKNNTKKIIQSNNISTQCPFSENDNHICSNIDKEDLNLIMQNSINNYNCALSKKILIQGKIFITFDSIYFISLFNVLFFKNSVIRIKYKDIKSVEKLTVLHFIPNSLKIITKYKTFIFMSFVHRDHAYDLITDMVKENRNTKEIPKKGIVFHIREDKDDDDYNSNSEESKNEYKFRDKIKCLKREELFPKLDNEENRLHIETRNGYLELNIDIEEKQILELNNYVNCKKHINSLYVNKNFKNIFLELFAKFDNDNPLVRTVLDKKATDLSYDKFESLDKIFQKKKCLKYESIYNILLFDDGKKIFGLPERSNVKEIINFFFFKNIISIQKSNILLCKVPLAGCFRTIITININNLEEISNSTQIDFLYDIEFLKSTFFKSKIEGNTLPKLEETVISLKEYTENSIYKKFNKNKIKKKDILIDDKNYGIQKALVSPHSSNDNINKNSKMMKLDDQFTYLETHFKWLNDLSYHRGGKKHTYIYYINIFTFNSYIYILHVLYYN
ncbi:conserved Plasmodium protein, unknown function [Plasmodium relictum]|uniref:VASt domain-containing protein n=1 Tax=Plasmodium relictum TaxID=85471 RepID=A0A1J1H1E0_PLARL|nr:conserved Plasmodium protein, unknown function [Plasmodium relictum]CRG98492.1 conserved Plasmodium protein, unknown function [Plasmodium relictum]